MMIYVCDRCHKRMNEGETINQISMVMQESKLRKMKVDLCDQCYMEMMMFLDGEPLGSSTEKSTENSTGKPADIQEQGKKTKPARKTGRAPKPAAARPEEEIDTGKCRALYKAGWGIKEIAVELKAEEKKVEEVLNGK